MDSGGEYGGGQLEEASEGWSSVAVADGSGGTNGRAIVAQLGFASLGFRASTLEIRVPASGGDSGCVAVSTRWVGCWVVVDASGRPLLVGEVEVWLVWFRVSLNGFFSLFFGCV